MAGKIRHLKERNGRYSARLVVLKELRSIVGKAELEIQLGADRRQALARHPAAVASLQATITAAERKAKAGKPVAACYPMTPQEIAVATYESLAALDLEIREQDFRFANLDVDEGLVADLRLIATRCSTMAPSPQSMTPDTIAPSPSCSRPPAPTEYPFINQSPPIKPDITPTTISRTPVT